MLARFEDKGVGFGDEGDEGDEGDKGEKRTEGVSQQRSFRCRGELNTHALRTTDNC